MKTPTRRTRWITAFLTLTLLTSLVAAPALAGEPTDPDDPYPQDIPQHPEDPLPEDPYVDVWPLYPTDNLDDQQLDGSLILSVMSWLISVAL